MHNRFLEYAVKLIQDIDSTQQDNIDKASDLIVHSLKNQGIIQAFGSGHSYAAAIELVERAGGLFAAKLIKDPALGMYETVEGVGNVLMRKVEIKPEDVVVIASYSGRNPLCIEVAQAAKKNHAKLIAITALDVSKKLVSRHSSGKLLYELADVVLDMRGEYGDAAIQVDPLPAKICPASSIAAASLIQATLLRTVEKLVEQGITPDIRISANTDPGTVHNLELQKKYAHRIFRI